MDSSSCAMSLQRAQSAPQFFSSQKRSTLGALAYLLPARESVEQWELAEKLITACLRTGDDKSAHMCLEQLAERFGATNERVMGLQGLYQEAVVDSSAAAEKVLREYEEILRNNPTNIAIAKRRATLLRSLSRFSDATKALVTILELSPTDAEAWAELSDLYVSLGLFAQASYCLEEVLLVAPNAWNIHARHGEVLYMLAISDNNASATDLNRTLSESTRRFCRSIELCEDYVRGYCGLKLATERLIASNKTNRSSNEGDDTLAVHDVRELNKKATERIAAIVESDPTRHDQPEMIVAKALVDKRLPAASA